MTRLQQLSTDPDANATDQRWDTWIAEVRARETRSHSPARVTLVVAAAVVIAVGVWWLTHV